jgi:hypothetical protein
MFARGNEVRPFARAKPRSAFATPLGDVAVDVGTVEFLRDAGLVTIDKTPHTPEHVSMTSATCSGEVSSTSNGIMVKSSRTR